MNFQKFFHSRVLLEANTSKRKEYLVNKYGKKLKKAFVENWEHLRGEIVTHTNIPDMHSLWKTLEFDSTPEILDSYLKIFVEKIVEEIDPTRGKFSEWIIKGYLFLSEHSNFKSSVLGRFFEDSYRITNSLKDYMKYKKVLVSENPRLSDLNSLKHYRLLEDIVEGSPEIQKAKEEEEEKRALKLAEKDAERILDNENYLIVSPKTEQASCAYGRGTRWCTAATGSLNYFDRYNRDGPLYIVIEKKTQEKFQFHFQSRQFMNSKDEPLNLNEFFKEHEELRKSLAELAKQNDDMSFAMIADPGIFEEIHKEYKEGKEVERFKDLVNNDLSLLIKLAKKDAEEANRIQKPTFLKERRFEFEKGGVWINSEASEWSDLSNFVRTRSRSSFVEDVLNGEPETYYSDHQYESYYWDYVDDKNTKLIQNYLFNEYQEEVETEEVKNFAEENNAEEVKELLTRSFNDLTEWYLSGKAYDACIEAIKESLGQEIRRSSGDRDYIWFWWELDDLEKMVNDVNHFHREEHYDENMTVKEFMDNYHDYLEEEGMLEEVDFDSVLNDYPSSNDSDNKSEFNERLNFYLMEELDVTFQTSAQRQNTMLKNQGQKEFDF